MPCVSVQCHEGRCHGVRVGAMPWESVQCRESRCNGVRVGPIPCPGESRGNARE